MEETREIDHDRRRSSEDRYLFACVGVMSTIILCVVCCDCVFGIVCFIHLISPIVGPLTINHIIHKIKNANPTV